MINYTALQTETSKGAAGAARIVPPAFAAIELKVSDIQVAEKPQAMQWKST